MTDERSDFARRSMRARKLRDAALVLPLIGIFMFLTPIPGIFAGETPEQFPRLFAYIYGVWFLLIVVSGWISRRLLVEED